MQATIKSILIENVGMADVMPGFRIKMELSGQPVYFKPVKPHPYSHEVHNRLGVCLNHKKHNLQINWASGTADLLCRLKCSCGFILTLEKSPIQSSDASECETEF